MAEILESFWGTQYAIHLYNFWYIVPNSFAPRFIPEINQNLLKAIFTISTDFYQHTDFIQVSRLIAITVTKLN